MKNRTSSLQFQIGSDEDPYEVRPPVCKFQLYAVSRNFDIKTVDVLCDLTAHKSAGLGSNRSSCELEHCPIYQTWKLLEKSNES